MKPQTKLPFLLMTIVAGTLALTPVLSSYSVNATPAGGAEKRNAPTPTAPGAAKLYSRLHDAANLLEKGDAIAAAQALEEAGQENMIIREGDLSEAGALNAFSSTTLTMRLGRLMTAQADKAAQSGDRATALAWIVRCQSLARQALSTTEPTIAALKVARYLDTRSGKVEKEVRKRWDTPRQAAMVAQREEQLKQVWRDEILERIMAVRDASPGRNLHNDQEPDLASDLITYYKTRRAEAFAAVPRTETDSVAAPPSRS